MDFQRFLHSHASQLDNIPRLYWRALYEKLQYEVYDAGKHFCMSHGEGGWEVLVSSAEGLTQEDRSCIFLVDHAWTFQVNFARRQLESISGLAARIAALMDLIGNEEDDDGRESYDADSESGNERETWSDSDEGEDGVKAQGVATGGLSHDSSDHAPLEFQLKQDDYESGDLGDVSHACHTDANGGGDRDVRDVGDSGRAKKIGRRRQEHRRSSGPGQKDDKDGVQGGGEGRVISQTCELVNPGSGESSEVIISLPSKELVEEILLKMWRYCHAYHINNSLVPMWYIMDEFGSRIRQSTNPTVAMVSFFYIPAQLAFTVFWPLKRLARGDIVSCNFLPACVKPGLEQVCHALPWSHDNHLTLDDPLWKDLDRFEVPKIEERCNESLPDHTSLSPPLMLNYNVYTDMKLVESFLKHPSFHLVSSKDEADILWLAEHFKDFNSLAPNQMVNQFPCENVLTCKDLLATVAKRGNGGQLPDWLPLTFNLLYELPKLVHEYLERKDQGADNLWIIKPWNLGRSLDINITDNLVQIIRLAQCGPKVGCKYITDPVLFHRPELGWVKFDIRYMILLRSLQPLEAYIYDIFWLRFANKPFVLDNFTEYEVHFTVMNYNPDFKLKQIHYNDFIPLFEEQYPHHRWADVQEQTLKLLRDLLVSASTGSPPDAISPFAQSRAIYGADLMLEKIESGPDATPTIKPLLLEINYCPDCVRVCKYQPDFFNHMFEVLFMGITTDIPVHRIA